MQNYVTKWKVTPYITKWTLDITNQEWDCEIALKSLWIYQLNDNSDQKTSMLGIIKKGFVNKTSLYLYRSMVCSDLNLSVLFPNLKKDTIKQ